MPKHKNKLSELNIEKESLLEEKENLLNKKSEIKEEILNYGNTIPDLNTKIKKKIIKKRLKMKLNFYKIC